MGIKGKILADKLRHLQKARHSALPNIIEYGFDEEQNAFAIVYEILEGVKNFKSKVSELKNQSAISSIIELVDCLQELHLKFQINHGDIHPANEDEWNGHIRTVEKVFALNAKCKNKINILIDAEIIK